MPIRYMHETGARGAGAGPGGPPCAVFEGACAPEEADGLLDWLRASPDAVCDLAACGDLHTALLQLLLAARARLAARPADPVLAACLAELPAAEAAAGPDSEPDGEPEREPDADPPADLPAPAPARARRARASVSSEQAAP